MKVHVLKYSLFICSCQCEVSEEYSLKLSGTKRTFIISHSLVS